MIVGVAYGVVTIGRTGPYLAWLVARHGRQTRALEALVRANPADATAHRDLAQLWLVRRRPRRALDHAERALAREPDDIELRYLIAQCRLALGEHAVAAEALQAIAARDPRFRYGEPTLRA
ncbi:MAG: tetratricopeptide repeat protein, partial [Deltaproteobacteria bacterium]|nr:tetratricopeptide repeat protein [Deltaproteobacteria bacterium]